MNVKLVIGCHDRALYSKQKEASARIAMLEKDQRQDDADLLKVRRNVYGLLGDTLAAFQKQGGDALARYRELIQHLNAVWGEAREQAFRYLDAKRLAVEEIKLDALKEAVALLKSQTGEGDA